ncbi:cupin domain-containing protein [Staphylococcus warneri]|uniref:cupin domain-containing protein n=1 Tax=Staphylococcus TaxID=1279 RepID=UPI000F53E00D|nr:cupin domain-containing protein [Staphylococcus warneri]MCI2788886.1 cupin domain-containing protein [Staphylococcus warneri]RQM97171.1 cupin [Staphylococcus warneri]
MTNAQYWIDQLQMTPHPEGGYFKESIRHGSMNSTRAAFSSIYFLLTSNDISHFHRIDADEVWYYHAGESLTIHMIMPDGKYEAVQLGTNIEAGKVLQYVVPKGTIFASSFEHDEGFCLVGCMCQPAFEYKHFELFEAHELLALYPEHQTLIDQYALKEK